MEWVAGFAWNEWQVSAGLGGWFQWNTQFLESFIHAEVQSATITGPNHRIVPMVFAFFFMMKPLV